MIQSHFAKVVNSKNLSAWVLECGFTYMHLLSEAINSTAYAVSVPKSFAWFGSWIKQFVPFWY